MRRALLIALAIFLVLLFLTTRSTLFDRDEPRFARAAVEMVESGNLLYPTFNGELRPDKPIGIYWLMSLSVRAFGANEMSVRLWAPIGIAIAALATFSIGRRLLGPRAGLAAMLVLASSPLVLFEGSIATTDAVLLAATTTSIAIFVRTLVTAPRVRDHLLLAVALAGAQLVKGPVGLAIPLLAFAATFVLLRRELSDRGRRIAATALAALFSVALFLAWALPANAATGGRFAARGIGDHLLARIARPLEGHGGSFVASLPYYALVVLVGFLPWTLHLPAALVAAARGRSLDRRARAILLGWCATTFLLMTFVATKLPHYVLPMWPALALLVAAYFGTGPDPSRPDSERRWRRIGAIVYACTAAVLVGLLVLVVLIPPAEHMRAPGAAGAVLFAGAAAIGLARRRRAPIETDAVRLGLAHGVALIATLLLALPAIEKTKVASRLAETIRARSSAGVPVARYGFVEPSLDFYLDRGPIETLSDDASVLAWSERLGAGVLVVPRERVEQISARLPADRLAEIAIVSGFNLSKGRPIDVVVLGRDLDGN